MTTHHEITGLRGLLCSDGDLLPQHNIKFSSDTGMITEVEVIEHAELNEESCPADDGNNIIAPGLLELQTNGMCGVHFTTLTFENHIEKLQLVARAMVETGVTAWYATIPTVSIESWKKILPLLKPKDFTNIGGAPLLGAHVEGPFLHPSKKGAHNDTFFKTPATHNYREIYGEENLRDVIRYITLAPELDGAIEMIKNIKRSFPHIVVSIGHSSATYEQAVAAVQAGVTGITHLFNAMTALGHREPGIPGLMGVAPSLVASEAETEQTPFFTIIPDAVHIHPAILRLAFNTNPEKCILITDSIELAGLPDGIYPPNGQITYTQRKLGNRATNVADVSKGEKETLIGSCITLSEGVRIMMNTADVNLAQAVQAASTNIANLMKDGMRGSVEVGKRADLVVFDKTGHVKQTWIAGKLIWSTESPPVTTMI